MSIGLIATVVGIYWIFIGMQTIRGQRIPKGLSNTYSAETLQKWAQVKGKVYILQGIAWIALTFSVIYMVIFLIIIFVVVIFGCLIGDLFINKKYVGKFLIA